MIASIVKKYPASAEYPEYIEYQQKKEKASATDFIDAFVERNSDRIGNFKKLVSYIAERPSVEKLGRHGLFSQTDDKIDLDAVADEVASHQGILWTHVISLRREDAERLRVLNAELNMDEREVSLIDGEPDKTQLAPPQRKGGAS